MDSECRRHSYDNNRDLFSTCVMDENFLNLVIYLLLIKNYNMMTKSIKS